MPKVNEQELKLVVYQRGDLSQTHNSNQANPSDQPQFDGRLIIDYEAKQ